MIEMCSYVTTQIQLFYSGKMTIPQKYVYIFDRWIDDLLDAEPQCHINIQRNFPFFKHANRK